MIPNLVKIFGNLDFIQNFRKFMISLKYNLKVFYFGQSFRNNLDISLENWKISILGKIFENVDFGLNFWKIHFGQGFRKF